MRISPIEKFHGSMEGDEWNGKGLNRLVSLNAMTNSLSSVNIIFNSFYLNLPFHSPSIVSMSETSLLRFLI